MYIDNIKHLNQLVPPYFISSRSIKFQKANTFIELNKNYLCDLFNSFYFRYLNHNNELSNANISITLSSTILRDKYGINCKLYLYYLIDEGYIVKTRNYLKGSHCNTYQLIKSKIQSIDLIEYKSTNYNLIFYYNHTYLNSNHDSKIYTNSLIKSIKTNLKHITIDVNGATNYLNTEYTDRCDKKYQKNLFSVKNIKDKNLYFISDSHGRIHTNFTVLKKEIKEQFVCIGNEPIKEKDIANSQSLFFLYLLSQNLDDSINQSELIQFQNNVINGMLYDQISSFSGKNRKTIKLQFFRYLFGVETSKFKDFTRIYPSISEFLKDYKISLGDYKILSHELQRLEGNFIFNGICKELTRRKIRYFTVHDSVCVKESDYHILDAIFEAQLTDMKSEIEKNIQSFYNKQN